ncbi:MAG: AraC family transcriptional regulator [Gammaproteobacteria bacterium]|nr:AraC family transcriptional regulator [Gammaproteobacteria bacterium]
MPTVPITLSKHLLPFAAVLRQHGLPVGNLLQLAGLPVNCLEDPGTLIPISATLHFRELCAQETGLPNIALTATEHIEIADMGGFGQALMSTPTLARSLQECCQLIGTQSSNLIMEISPQPDGCISFSHRVLTGYGRGEWHRALYTLALMIKIVRLADPDWSPSAIWIDSKATPERFEAIESLGSTNNTV